MYVAVLFIHSYVRWVVLILGVLAFFRAITGAAGGRPWTPRDERLGRVFAGVFNLQFLLGLLLYVALSPLPRAAFGDFGAAMGDRLLRFWAVEHIFGMVVATALVHIGQARARRARADAARHRTTAIFFGMALVAILASIPWPALAVGRPLFRW
jgi:hypothetical protein